MHQSEEKELVIRCLKNDVEAQNKLYKAYARKMYAVCWRFARIGAEADDILQEGFIKVFTKLSSFRHEGSLEGWVRKIMVNVSLEKFRKQQVMHPVDDIRVFENQHQPEEIIEKISADELIELIQSLPPRYRMVFNLYVMEGMNHKEIGEAMNIAEGTSKSNLARARDILKLRVNELYGEMPDTRNFSA